MGNFNFPSIDWAECVCSGGENSSAFLFLDAIQDSFLTQHVTECTRHRHGQQSSLLDLVLSSDPNFIDKVTNLSALGSSDHDCLLWKYKCYEECPGCLTDSDGVMLSSGDLIQSLSPVDVYKYLGVLEADNIKHNLMKDMLTKEYKRCVRKLLCTKLYSRNVISAINVCAVSLLRYSGGIIN